MSTCAVDPVLRRMHELAWRPGASMHQAWWPHLSLEAWQADYARRRACRDPLDRLIVARRGFPCAPLESEPDERSRALFALEPRFEALIVALGIVALACPEHLVMRTHRDALASYMDRQACDQLLAICRRWDAQAPVVGPAALVDAAFAAGTQWWQCAARRHADLTAQLLGTLLPPHDAGAAAPEDNAADWLLRLSRFL
ncbi:type III secretion system domain-containing protein [Trinickia caryophylli]|uniref:Type III secretion system subunit n=1 Tax=Trinickia caryophylli TaxID=28094 RepID=A0A1X7EWE5_TRICW|nr:type III secretion system domain-containing protein [Trinickia caryophylli]PMS09687.1 type III secretion system subunit [Trinickia caryophylli]TRX18458.1 type III secretion system subunit [Trinickia caryophylli]WQE10757.1 type III secretion system domain-containing protein [Trinickia caryophylli]SMF41572.1 Type III secretion system subunit [Trinickia caryophylli]GLU33132.1 hypothetical protein Busp01_29740 [Trinickia caryophylli]